VNVKAPLALELLRTLVFSRRQSPPQRMLCFLRGIITVSLIENVWSLRRAGATSFNPVKFANESAGTPQSSGFVETPVMPASPATFVIPAKVFVVFDRFSFQVSRRLLDIFRFPIDHPPLMFQPVMSALPPNPANGRSRSELLCM